MSDRPPPAGPAAARGPLGRRGLLTGGALAAAGALAVGVSAREGSGSTRPSGVTALRVRDYGAAGDGSADDTGPIQRCLNDVGPSGGLVWFDPGDYVVTAGLVPRSGTVLAGPHTPRYEPTVRPTSACRLRSGTGFPGGLLRGSGPDGQVTGVAVRGLALVGDGQGSGQHGVELPEVNTGEQAWLLQEVTIAGFTGDGLHGSLQVAEIDGCFVHTNRGWGIGVTGRSGWHDVRISNSLFFFNELGGMLLAGAGSGAIDVVNCRFERSGGSYGHPLQPIRAGAPGLSLQAAQFCAFVNCSTDANTGPGLLVQQPAGARTGLNNLQLTGCRFSRDGTGDQQRLPDDSAAVLVAGPVEGERPADLVMTGCVITAGSVDDGGRGGLIGPVEGLRATHARRLQWLGGRIDDGVQTPYALTDVPGASLVDVARGLLTLPTAPPAGDVPDGAVYLDPVTSRLVVRLGGGWRGTPLA